MKELKCPLCNHKLEEVGTSRQYQCGSWGCEASFNMIGTREMWELLAYYQGKAVSLQKIRDANKRYKSKNKEKISQYRKEFYQKNLEKMREYKRAYYRRKKNEVD